MSIIDATAYVTKPEGWASLKTVVGVAIHHTVTTISPSATEAEEIAHIRAIDQYHVRQGWHGIGYHYLCFPSGRVYRVGWGARAHVANRNHELIGIAWVADLSARKPNTYEIAAAATSLRDAWARIGSKVQVKGHRDWAVQGWGTSCPGQGTAVIEAVVAEAAKENDMGEIDNINSKLTYALTKLERLERLLCTNGGELTVVADVVNATTLGNVTGQTVKIGDRVVLKGDQIPTYLDRMGNNMWIGLQQTQEAAARVNAALEALKAGQKPQGAGEAIDELRLLRFADGSVRLIK